MKWMNKKILIICIVLVCILLILNTYAHFASKDIEIAYINVSDNNIPNEFNNFEIMHISDLHNKEFGENNEKLLRIVRMYSPDIIVITGDILDSYHTDTNIAVNFIKKAQLYAPIYYANGNHELRVKEEYEAFKEGISQLNVTILENEKTQITKNGQTIELFGVIDPSIGYVNGHIDDKKNMNEHLDMLDLSSDNYKILLSHRPELLDVYCQRNINLVFSGHAHGGQIVLPYLGALYSPNQGFFPKYTSGIYSQGETNLIVSRGMGNNALLARINNNSQIIIATLKSE